MSNERPPQGGGRRGKIRFSKKWKTKPYGALDLGTNNCRLLIAKPVGSGFRVTASFSRIVRLGEGLSTNRFLSDAAMARTLDALLICSEKLHEQGVVKTRSIATEACRRASNCNNFFDRIERKTGLIFETISIKEEARLAMISCQSLLTENTPYALAFDIGGGSTELIWSKRDQKNNYEIIDVLSLPFGVLTLSESWDTNIDFRECYKNMVAYIAEQISPFCNKNCIRKKVHEGDVQMLGTSGTVTTLGAVHLKLPYYIRSRVDGLKIGFDELANTTRVITDLRYEDRVALPCIGRERAELVIPGCAILDAICRSWPVGHLRIADRGLREGMLMELMLADGIPILGNPATISQFSSH